MPIVRSEQLRFPLTGAFVGTFEGAITGSIDGTASFAISSSYAVSSSHTDFAYTASYISGSNVKGAVSASLTASYVYQAENAWTSSYNVFTQTSSYAESSSFANAFEVGTDLFVRGTISASAMHIDVISASVLLTTGSNIFGDDVNLDFQELTGSVGITGSFTMDTASVATIPNLTGSLLGTSSYALAALTSSYAVSSSYARSSSYTDTASWAVTSSYALAVSGGGSGNFSGVFTGSFSGSLLGELSGSVRGGLTGTASYASESLHAVYALTASYASNVPETASYALMASQSQFAGTAFYVSGTGTGSFTGEFIGLFTGSLQGNVDGRASFAYTADIATSSFNANTASWAVNVHTASRANTAAIADSAYTSSYIATASYAENSRTASYSISGAYSDFANTSSFSHLAATASHLADNATASYAYNSFYSVTASLALNANSVATASWVTGSGSGIFFGEFSGSFHGVSDSAKTASYAYDLINPAHEAYTASYIQQAYSASYAVSASFVDSASYADSSSLANNAQFARSVSASTLIGYTDRVASGSATAGFNVAGGFYVKGTGIIAEGSVSASAGYTGYLHDTASQAETASYANSIRIGSGAVVLDGGVTIFNKASRLLSGSEIGNGIRFINEGNNTWNIFDETVTNTGDETSLRITAQDPSSSVWKAFQTQNNKFNASNVFSSADGIGSIVSMNLGWQGQPYPVVAFGYYLSGSNERTASEFVTTSFITADGVFNGTASFAAGVDPNALDPSRITLGAATASISVSGGLQVNVDTTITGSLNVVNNITASNIEIIGTASIRYLHVEYESASIIVATGSNKFGDEFTDVQQFTGSVAITGSLIMDVASRATLPNLTGSLYGTASYAIVAETASFLITASFSQTSYQADLVDGGFYP